MNKYTVKDLNVENKKVFVRCDFNVPLDENQNITDLTRIKGALPTIQYLLDHNAKVILCSHLGRPKGKVVPELSLKPVATELSKELGKEVKLAKDIVGPSAHTLIENMKSGEAILLENVRFDPREEQNDEEFSKELASLAEVYVNDAFGTCHRAHASTAGMVKYFKQAGCGFLIQKELEVLGDTLSNPERPLVGILGGKKVSSKIGVINSLLEKVDVLLIGGGMSYTFYKAMGYNIGDSICENDKLEEAKSCLQKAKEKHVKMFLPIDVVVAKEPLETGEMRTVKCSEIPDGYAGCDIGAETIKIYKDELSKAKTILWNGPVGIFEMDRFAVGTNEIAKYLATLTDCKTIIGGGDSASAINKIGLSDKMTHISTGGGASLEFIEGKQLPGIVCLPDKQ